jgi:hypothetical protein
LIRHFIVTRSGVGVSGFSFQVPGSGFWVQCKILRNRGDSIVFQENFQKNNLLFPPP